MRKCKHLFKSFGGEQELFNQIISFVYIFTEIKYGLKLPDCGVCAWLGEFLLVRSSRFTYEPDHLMIRTNNKN